MKPTWVVQENLTHAVDYANLIAACQKHGNPYKSIKVIPFSDEIDDIDAMDPPVIFYGSTTMLKKIINKKERWSPGMWFDAENFRTSTWLKHYGKDLLNSDAEIMPFREVKARVKHKSFFIKPDDDLKDFSGTLLYQEDLAAFDKWYDDLSSGGYTFTMDIPVVISTPKYMGREWRLIIVNGKVVTGSLYKMRSMSPRVQEQPKGVVEFAERLAATWQPMPVFVMDVCDHEDGLKVVELNCFNVAGFYACDVEKIVVAVNGLYT